MNNENMSIEEKVKNVCKGISTALNIISRLTNNDKTYVRNMIEIVLYYIDSQNLDEEELSRNDEVRLCKLRYLYNHLCNNDNVDIEDWTTY